MKELLPELQFESSLPALAEALQRFCDGDPAESLPWVAQLSNPDRGRLRDELTLILSEPEVTAEPLDWPEVIDILREYSELAGYEGASIFQPPARTAASAYVVDVRPQDLRARFLALHPTAADRLERGSLKKLGNRDIWQINLPDGYRMRYYVAEPERTVHVVYLGPHPDGEADGREQAVRAAVRRRRHGDS